MMVAILTPSCALTPRSFSGWQRVCSALTTPVGWSRSKAMKPPYEPSSTLRRGEHLERNGRSWTVVLDPDGNEFCVG
jgi:hypothetical protein